VTAVEPGAGRVGEDGEHVAANAWDCRFVLDGRWIDAGSSVEVPVVFLSPDDVTRLLRVGDTVRLTHGYDIGEAVVTALDVDGGPGL
jgi:hypothetical protein